MGRPGTGCCSGAVPGRRDEGHELGLIKVALGAGWFSVTSKELEELDGGLKLIRIGIRWSSENNSVFALGDRAVFPEVLRALYRLTSSIGGSSTWEH